VLIKEDDPKDINFRPLAENWSGSGPPAGGRLEARVGGAAHAGPLYFDGGACRRATPLYISNAAVLVRPSTTPTTVALGLLGELFKDRMVVGIHAVDLCWVRHAALPDSAAAGGVEGGLRSAALFFQIGPNSSGRLRVSSGLLT